MLYYAESTRGFYDTAINRVIPEDAVAVTRQQHAALLAAQAGGKEIVSSPGGVPIAVERRLTREQIVEGVRIAASAALAASDSAIIAFYENGAPVPEQWKAYRASLRAIISGQDQPTTLPKSPDGK